MGQSEETIYSLPFVELSGASNNLDNNSSYKDLIELDTSYDGSGVSVVVIDTGIDTNHSHFGPDLNQDGISDRIIKALNFGSNTPENWLVGGGDHGTHVAGIIGDPARKYQELPQMLILYQSMYLNFILVD